MIKHSRPCTRPMPVMMPAAGASSSYIPFAASGESSRKGVSGSSNAASRSRGGTFPCSRCRARYFAPPPCRDFARRALRSLTSPLSASRFAPKSAEEVSRCVSRGSTAGRSLLHVQHLHRVEIDAPPPVARLDERLHLCPAFPDLRRGVVRDAGTAPCEDHYVVRPLLHVLSAQQQPRRREDDVELGHDGVVLADGHLERRLAPLLREEIADDVLRRLGRRGGRGEENEDEDGFSHATN